MIKKASDPKVKKLERSTFEMSRATKPWLPALMKEFVSVAPADER